MKENNIYEAWPIEAFNLWQEWSDNAIRVEHIMRADNDLQEENERISLILKSMEIKKGIDYIRNTWEIRFADDELYGIFILKY